MARRRRDRESKPSVFELALAAAFLIGIALFGIPKKPANLLLGVVALLAFAVAIALAVRVWKRRSEKPLELDRLEPALRPQVDPWFREPEADLYPMWKQSDAAPSATITTVDTRTWSIELLKRLEWRRFEEVCAGYFEALGFRAETTRFGADGGVDIKLYMSQSEKPSAIVQCKAWTSYTVGVKPVRELRGVMAAEKIAKGIFVTSGGFTKEAKNFAEKEEIHLVDGAGLFQKITALAPQKASALLQRAIEGDFLTPTCPSCGVKMVHRESKKDGKTFWGCRNFPRCRHTFLGMESS